MIQSDNKATGSHMVLADIGLILVMPGYRC